jgi:hypothetical protein
MQWLDWIIEKDIIPWCSFREFDLSNGLIKNVSGVYCIFQRIPPQDVNDHIIGYLTIHVGSGDITDRIRDHRDKPDFEKYDALLMTWAEAGERQHEGIERFLANQLNPVHGTHPIAKPIPVNLPY